MNRNILRGAALGATFSAAAAFGVTDHGEQTEHFQVMDGQSKARICESLSATALGASMFRFDVLTEGQRERIDAVQITFGDDSSFVTRVEGGDNYIRVVHEYSDPGIHPVEASVGVIETSLFPSHPGFNETFVATSASEDNCEVKVQIVD